MTSGGCVRTEVEEEEEVEQRAWMEKRHSSSRTGELGDELAREGELTVADCGRADLSVVVLLMVVMGGVW